MFGAGIRDPKEQGEDCLTLTVWSPDTSASLPVLVWIPGGGFVFGAGQLDMYDGARLAASGNVVVVNVTYRLGPLGGLELSALGDTFDTNLILRDQIQALTWVQQNIAAFGGDPSHVTIFGESAGGTSVCALAVSPKARGLFTAAVAQSPSLVLVRSMEARRREGELFRELSGKSADELRDLTPLELRKVFMGMQHSHSGELPGTLIAGMSWGDEWLPEDPVVAARTVSDPVPLLIGTNRNEATLFAKLMPGFLPTTTESNTKMFAAIAEQLGGENQSELLATLYRGSASRRAVAIASDAVFNRTMWQFADAYSEHAPTYVYRYDHATLPMRLLGFGATHGSEIVHVHQNYFVNELGVALNLPNVRPPAVGKRMHRAWLDFAQCGNPGWQQYHVPQRATRVFATRGDATVDDPDRARREVWDTIAWYR